MEQQIGSYTVEARQAALQLAGAVGPAEAGRQLGIPSGTLSCWMYKSRRGQEGFTLPAEVPGKSTPARDPARSVTSPGEPAMATSAEPTVRASGGAPTSVSASSNGQEQSSTSAPARQTRSRVARLYTPSEKARALERIAQVGITAASKELGISRFSLYDWRRRVQRAAASQADSPTSGPAPADIEATRDREILNTWKQHPGLGPSQIRNQLRRTGVKVSVTTVRRVMEEAGYRTPKVQRDEHPKRYESVRPNHLWHLDFVHRNINRTNTFTLILIDDHSRFVVGHGVDEAERADMVLSIFEEAVARHGRPESVMHDKGSAFWSWKGISRFTALLTELGVDQVVAEHKQWNGKVEVFNANLAKELFDVQRFYDVGEMKRRLTAHLHFYNHRRTHHALGGLLVPADRFYGRVEEVMARIEAGAGAQVHTDLLDLRERCLELFKVVSRGGRPEVWLLGQPLLVPSS